MMDVKYVINLVKKPQLLNVAKLVRNHFAKIVIIYANLMLVPSVDNLIPSLLIILLLLNNGPLLNRINGNNKWMIKLMRMLEMKLMITYLSICKI